MLEGAAKGCREPETSQGSKGDGDRPCLRDLDIVEFLVDFFWVSQEPALLQHPPLGRLSGQEGRAGGR